MEVEILNGVHFEQKPAILYCLSEAKTASELELCASLWHGGMTLETSILRFYRLQSFLKACVLGGSRSQGYGKCIGSQGFVSALS